MAQMIPQDVKHLSRSTPGERALFRAIERYLPDEWICYASQRLEGGNTPDFVLIGPDLGILILEEKNLPITCVREANTEQWKVIRDGQEDWETHPLRQARNYSEHAIRLLQRIAKLRNIKGRLKFCYGHGVVLSAISRGELKSTTLHDPPLARTFNENLVICKDEIPNISYSGNEFEKKLFKMNSYFKFKELTEEEIEAIRYALFPISRARPLGDWLEDRNAKVRAMTIEQEQISRGIGKNDKLPHRLVRGVVGSGKSIVLKARARILSEDNSDWSILITFFTRSLIGFFINEKPPNVTVMTLGQAMYNEWIKYNSRETFPDPKKPQGWDKMRDSFKEGLLKGKKYQAILVDEAQDLTPSQADCLRFLLDDETNCAFFCGDGAQNIFNRKVVWKNHGFYFAGRSTKKEFCTNYRNTQEIYDFASNFLKSQVQNDQNEINDEDDSLDLYLPVTCKRNGPDPQLKIFKDLNEEREFVIREISRLIKTQNVSPSYIGLILPFATEKQEANIKPYLEMLEKSKIPYYWLSKDDRHKSGYRITGNYVVISTPESAKGLEWEIVFTPSMTNYPGDRALSLLYVATTRAREILYPSMIKP